MIKLILKCTWNCKKYRIPKTISKKNKIAATTLPNFKTYFKSTVNKTTHGADKGRGIPC